jgi:iron complex outermembrane receptor protein
LLLSTTCIIASDVEARDASPVTCRGQLLQEEVIVTARKREEMLQETPVAITAFSNASISF